MAALCIIGTLSNAWHCGVAIVAAGRPAQTFYRRAKTAIDIVMRVVLILLGARLLAARW